MKIKQIITTIVVMAAYMSACTTEDYYRNANRSPRLSSTTDLDVTDTIKTSAASNQRTYIFSVTAEDENGNMNTLMVSATGGKAVIMVDEEPSREAIELSKERYKFTRQIEFTPNGNGLHVITARVVDDFNTSRSVEKKVFSFTNMRPKVECLLSHQRIAWDAVNYTLDFTTSYDRDARWGGAIDSVFFSAVCTDYIENDGSFYTEYYPFSTSVKNPFTNSGVIFMYPFYDDGDIWMTDIYAWVKDNEGLTSDTVHFSIGHVE